MSEYLFELYVRFVCGGIGGGRGGGGGGGFDGGDGGGGCAWYLAW